ncbi:MAG: N-acyl homoserine lactonase family protein [Acidimicrobiales bacterium]
MSETRVFLLDGGTLVIDGYHLYWNAGPGGEVRFPCYSVLVDHPEGKFLFDTGYDLAHVEKVLPFEKPIQSEEQTIPGQLKAIGYDPSEITHVINSHYHFDHVGGNKYCTSAVTIAHQKELDQSHNHQPFERLGYSDMSFDEIGPRYELIEGDTEIAKGIRLFETPGHTAGHTSMMVSLDGRRPMLFTGDAVYTRQSIEKTIIAGFHLDPTKSVESMRRLSSLAEEHDAELFYSHDADSYADWQKAPLFYR